MIEALKNLDRRAAAGVLARAALGLEGEGNPAVRTVLKDEESLRRELFHEIRSLLGIAADDESPKALQALGDFLDKEADKLLGPTDTDSALKRLAERGDLPSDLYEFNVVSNISDFHQKRYKLEYDLIEATIHRPDREQHFGRAASYEPSLVSLFYRRFTTPYPFKNFGMLIAAGRDGLMLHVHQAWRIYEAAVDTRGTHTLVDMLQRFSDKFGADIDVDGKRGHFFLHTERPLPPTITLRSPHGKVRTYTVSQFLMTNRVTGRARATLVVAIDLGQYRTLLDRMEVPRNQILELVAHDAFRARAANM